MAFQEFRGLFTDGYDRMCLVKCQSRGCWEFRRGSYYSPLWPSRRARHLGTVPREHFITWNLDKMPKSGGLLAEVWPEIWGKGVTGAQGSKVGTMQGKGMARSPFQGGVVQEREIPLELSWAELVGNSPSSNFDTSRSDCSPKTKPTMLRGDHTCLPISITWFFNNTVSWVPSGTYKSESVF